MFEVEIKNLKTKARLGIKVKERKKFQTLFVTVRFKYQITRNKSLDDLKNLKDYSTIVKFLKLFIEKSSYKSLERLVFECSHSLEKKFKVKKVFISINKAKVAKRYGCESLSVSK